MAELIRFLDADKINGKQAKDVLVEMFESGKSAAQVVREKGLEQISDASEIETRGEFTRGMTIIDQRHLREVPEATCTVMTAIDADAANLSRVPQHT